MMANLDRRTFLGAALTLAAAAPYGRLLADAGEAGAKGLSLGPPERFSYAALVKQAQALAARPYRPPQPPSPEVVERIDYEAHGKLRYPAELALFRNGPGVYPATLFHIGRYFPKPVRIYTLGDGVAREVLFASDYFEMPADSPARELAEGGFAGFRLHEAKDRDDWPTQDWLAFLGASYFRAIGALGQYGMSARGIAVNTAAEEAEEFPDFTAFYIEPPVDKEEPVLIHALLDGPSIAGAFRFAARRTEGVVMDVEARVFTRRAIARLGIAPLTSMFWYAQHNRGFMVDWRPEVHDSDGLALWRGNGERVWRPLNNPDHTRVSSFEDDNPRGFGLLQRDRAFAHYLDGVNYHRRPTVWVEPLDEWGRGAVELVEIPTDDEIHDNIVAFWVPSAPVEPRQALTHRYRLHWLADEPYPQAGLARVAATRIGRGGEPGKPRPEGVTKFVVEFAGAALETLPPDAEIDADITASRGTLSYEFVEPVGDTGRWRAHFDLAIESLDPVELRLYLRRNGSALSETWLYQHLPNARRTADKT